jgi:hypothetical protein
MPEEQLQKIRFYDPDVGYENLWAEKDAAGLYVIKSVPYFVYDISVGDTVRASENNTDQVLSFSERVSHSGHTTVRVRPETFTLSDEDGKALLKSLRSFGAVVETLPPRLVAVDIPDKVQARSITDYLTSRSIPWEWADEGTPS